MLNDSARMQFQVGRYHLNSNYRIEHYVDTEMKDIERHYHEYYECLFFYSGDVSYWVGNHCHDISPNDVLLLNVAEVHLPKMRSASPPYDRISLSLDKGFVQDLSREGVDFTALFDSKGGRIIHTTVAQSWEIKALLSKLENSRDSEALFGQRLLCNCYITELLIVLARAIMEDPVIFSSGSDDRIRAIKDYVSQNLSEDLSLDAIAANFHLSKYHLSHEFTKHTGMSLHAYIVCRRLVKAKECIRSDISLRETCAQCGFNDVTTLNRAFKKEFGMTPTQYYETL